MFTKSQKKKDVGAIFVGFAILMYGMNAMSGAVEPLAEVPEFTGMLVKFSNPILGVVAGAVLTAIIQSSSASVGILQALCLTGMVPFSAALPIIMGQNIGTCITAILSAIGASKNAKRAAMVHLYFNLIGTMLFMAVFYAINAAVHFSFMAQAATPAGSRSCTVPSISRQLLFFFRLERLWRSLPVLLSATGRKRRRRWQQIRIS